MLLHRGLKRLVPVAMGGIAFVGACSSSTNSHVMCEPAFSPKEFRGFPIKKIEKLSPNTKAFRLALPSADSEMGATTASFIVVKNGKEEKPDVRPYTPTTLNDEKGSFELVIKAYPGGKVSEYLFSLKEGDLIHVKGPFAKIKYEKNMKKTIGMIAGGTGITPMLQVIQEILKDSSDTTKISLVFANNSEEDILLKNRIDELAAKHRDRLSVTYVLASAGTSWNGERGFVSAKIVKDKMPAPGPDTLIMVCGPPPMMKAVSGDKTPDYKQGPVEGLLKDAGYNEDMVFKF